MRVIQFTKDDELVAAKVIDENNVQLINVVGGIFEAAQQCIKDGVLLLEWINKNLSDEVVSYQDIIDEGRLKLPVMHPDKARCLVAGTGLTHLGSADTRNAMHDTLSQEEGHLTDSMKMFKLGLEGGKPMEGEVGSQPEWFYKGDGYTLNAPEEGLPAPGFALDAGEEPELVGIYIIGEDRRAYRIGFAIGNEFSDHVTERQNYLWLAHSKLRYSAFGPELIIGELPNHLEGVSRILRDDKVLWEKEFLTGEDNMSHTLANLEHHHFKYEQFCQPGNMHVHYFGTSTLSFGDGIETQDGDVFEISVPEFGRALRNKIIKTEDVGLVSVKSL